MPRSAQTIIDHADELAARFETEEARPLPEPAQAAMADLRDAVLERGQAEAHINAAVATAHEAGASWSAIAVMLGTSRQAAQKRYG